jgi:hypothetical protein
MIRRGGKGERDGPYASSDSDIDVANVCPVFVPVPRVHFFVDLDANLLILTEAGGGADGDSVCEEIVVLVLV